MDGLKASTPFGGVSIPDGQTGRGDRGSRLQCRQSIDAILMGKYDMNKWITQCFAVVVIAGLTGLACGSDGGDESGGATKLEDQKLQGEIEGTEWVYTSGKAHISQEELVIVLFTDRDDPCAPAEGASERWEIRTRLPVEEKKFELGGGPLSEEPSHTATMVRDIHNKVVSEGFVDITSIEKTVVEGDLVAKMGESVVNGHFEATRCRNRESDDGSEDSG